MLRSVLAVVAGFASYGVVCIGLNVLQTRIVPGAFNADWTTDSSLLLALNLVLGVGYSIVSGFVCATVAPSAGTKPAMVLAAIELGVGIAVQRQYWDAMPLWYHVLFLVMIVPCVLIGAHLALRGRGVAPRGHRPS